jgi:hypothetical protein
LSGNLRDVRVSDEVFQFSEGVRFQGLSALEVSYQIAALGATIANVNTTSDWSTRYWRIQMITPCQSF